MSLGVISQHLVETPPRYYKPPQQWNGTIAAAGFAEGESVVAGRNQWSETAEKDLHGGRARAQVVKIRAMAKDAGTSKWCLIEWLHRGWGGDICVIFNSWRDYERRVGNEANTYSRTRRILAVRCKNRSAHGVILSEMRGLTSTGG